MTIERRRVIYEGRVQGVGFRMTAKRIASGFATSGYVRNLDDGRVELVVQGEPSVLAMFLGAIDREFGDMIRHIHVEQESPQGGAPSSFTIHYDSSLA